MTIRIQFRRTNADEAKDRDAALLLVEMQTSSDTMESNVGISQMTFSTSLILTKMCMKTMLRFHLLPLTMNTIKNKTQILEGASQCRLTER